MALNHEEIQQLELLTVMHGEQRLTQEQYHRQIAAILRAAVVKQKQVGETIAFPNSSSTNSPFRARKPTLEHNITRCHLLDPPQPPSGEWVLHDASPPTAGTAPRWPNHRQSQASRNSDKSPSRARKDSLTKVISMKKTEQGTLPSMLAIFLPALILLVACVLFLKAEPVDALSEGSGEGNHSGRHTSIGDYQSY